MAREVVVASRKNGKKVTSVCSRIDDFMEKTESKPFGEGAVKGDKGENMTVARKRARGEESLDVSGRQVLIIMLDTYFVWPVDQCLCFCLRNCCTLLPQ